MPRIKPDQTTPAIAAQQALWHTRQAADYWKESNRRNASPRARETARKRFLEHARFALPTTELDQYLNWFKQLSGNDYDGAEAIIRELWSEHLASQNEQSVASDESAKLQAVRELLALIGQQVEALAPIETRRAG